MRPLKLKITGLQSFRETQTIDFKTLTSGGVFGIFGPTGSGKSTILDALTLALYNKVERAFRGTQGIMNHAEDKMSVEFTFALGQQPHQRIFRVERNFTRGANDALNTAQCRLVELLPPEGKVERAVLADRVREIDEKIQQIIGLNVDDFTRAVVLPQNNFAKFLSLKAKDRRAMLERIFNLNKYGQKLNQVVADRQRTRERELEGLQGQQQSLEGASPEAVTAAKTQYEKAQAEERQTREEKENREQEHEKKQRHWEDQQRLEVLEKELGTLLAREAEIKEQENRLEKALKAEPLRPYLLSYNEAAATKNQMEKTFSQAQVEWNGTESAYKQARERAQAARKEWEENEPQLRARQYKLDQALTLENRTLKLEKDIKESTIILEKVRKEKNRLAAELTGVETRKKDLLTQKSKLQETINELQVDPRHRRLIDNAHTALKEYRQTQAQEEGINKKVIKQKEALEQNTIALQEACNKEKEARATRECLEADLANWEKQKPVSEDKLIEAREQLWQEKTIFEKLAQAEKDLKELQEEIKPLAEEIASTQKTKEELQAQFHKKEGEIKELQDRKTLLEEQQRHLETRARAALLARELKAGQPCPVCGSKDHPQPTTGQLEQTLVETTHSLEEINRQLELQKKKHQDLELEIRRCTHRIDSLTNDVKARLVKANQKERTIGEYREQLHTDWEALSLQQIRKHLNQQENNLKELHQDLTFWQETRAQKSKGLDRAREVLNQYSTEKQNLETLQKEKQKNLTEIEEEYREQKKLLQAREKTLQEARGSIAMEQIEGEAQKIIEQDSQLQNLIKERDKLEKYLTKLEETLIQIRQNQETAREKVQKEEHHLSSIKEQKAQLQGEIRDLTGGMPAKQTLDDVKEQLQRLKENREKAAATEQDTRAAYDETQKEYLQAQSNLENARKQAQKIHLALEKKVAAYNFTTRGEAEDALLDEEERQSLQENISGYREQEKELNREKEKLLSRLGEKRLSPEEWECWQEELKKIKEDHEASLTRMVKTQQTYETRQKNYDRWLKLEKERQKLETHKGRLEELKQLLRGNAFVEFMAAEKLARIARVASERLYNLTNNRYALEIEGKEGFIIRDDANGGVRRPVSSLSGGETFLASLALALALSAQIQLKGKYNLEFFFLDEGFGSLDSEALELALNTLEHLRLEQFQVGVISHVPEIRNRLPYRLLVTPPEPAGAGSRISLERA